MLNHVQGEVWKRVWIFWGQVWKRVWEMAFLGLKLGLDLEMRAAHPHQKFQRVPPGEDSYLGMLYDDPFAQYNYYGS